PFGPSRPNTSPCSTSKSMPLTASTPPGYVLRRRDMSCASRALRYLSWESSPSRGGRSHLVRGRRHPLDGPRREDVTDERKSVAGRAVRAEPIAPACSRLPHAGIDRRGGGRGAGG